MPIIYLSPSTQEFNPYIDGSGSEEYYMNIIADKMEPYLTASGIQFVRNTKEMTAASSIRASNSGNYDLHLALHSNASPEASAGSRRGSEVYFYPGSTNGQRAAEIIANNLKLIYPEPSLVRAIPTTNIGEVSKTKAPAVLIEYAYHDNTEDAKWIEENTEEIARNTVLSLADYFDIPFNYPSEIIMGTVATPKGGNLNIRQSPSTDSPVIGTVPAGQSITILATLPDWYLIRYGTLVGYVYGQYVRE